jgi:hypothetical protein
MKQQVADVLGVGLVAQVPDYRAWIGSKEAKSEHRPVTFSPRSYETVEQMVSASYYCLNSDTIDEVGAVFGYLHAKPYYCELVFDGCPDAYYTVAIIPEITKQCRREEIASEIKHYKNNISSWQLLELLGRGNYGDAIVWAQRKMDALSSIVID